MTHNELHMKLMRVSRKIHASFLFFFLYVENIKISGMTWGFSNFPDDGTVTLSHEGDAVYKER